MNLRSVPDILNKYAEFSKEDWRNIGITVVLTAFFFSFNDWGDSTFEVGVGLAYFIQALAIAFVVITLHHGTQRVFGFRDGIATEFGIWWWGIIIGLIVSVASLGTFSFLGCTSTEVATNKRMRLHRWRPFAGVREFSHVAIAGNLTVAIAVAAVVTMRTALQEILSPALITFCENFAIFGLLFMFCNLFPIPPLDGSKIIFASRSLYIMVFTADIIFTVLVLGLGTKFVTAPLIALLIAFILGTTAWFVHYFNYEQKDS